MSKKITIKSIVTDKVSGSSKILEKLNKYILRNADDMIRLRRDLSSIKKALKDFAAINSYIEKVEKQIDTGNTEKFKSFLTSFDAGKTEAYNKIYNNAKRYLSKFNTILTLSNSRTLLEVCKIWANDNKELKIIVCESRPKNEGLIFAKELAKAGIKVEVTTDASISNFIEKANAVIIGADKILKNGNVVNKTGSRNAAIICRHFRKPFYVLTTIDKFTKEDHFKQKNENSDNILKTKDKKITIYNYYFEEIERSLITKVITD
jgi:translation initiation factor 2B subunit (eIF-2B alpha/beta/delta family)